MLKGVVHFNGVTGMTTGTHMDSGECNRIGHGRRVCRCINEETGAHLKDAKEISGAKMKDGVFFARKKVKTALPVEKLR